MSADASGGDDWTVASYLAIVTDELPASLRRPADRGLAPALDVARAIEHDAREVLRYYPRSGRTDRLAGFLRVTSARSLKPVDRAETAEILADLLERIAREIDAQARAAAREKRPATVSRNLRDYRDALARLSPRPTTALLSMLAPRLRVERTVVEEDARAWVRAHPRERVLRSEFVDRYRDSGSPGGLNVRELLAVVRAAFPDVETASRGEIYLSLQNFADAT